MSAPCCCHNRMHPECPVHGPYNPNEWCDIHRVFVDACASDHIAADATQYEVDTLKARIAAAEKVVEAARDFAPDGMKAWTRSELNLQAALAAYDTATKAPDSPKETP